jgi:hypothetical protein
MKPIFLIPSGLLALLLSGCATMPQTEQAVSYAYAVGDRGQITLEEVVVSLPLRDDSAHAYQNLHVGLAAIVNPKKTTRYDPSTVEQIVRRLEARLAARELEVLNALGSQSLSGMQALRQRLASEAQAVVDDALQHWEHGPEYRVDVVVVALYWTDASVGRTTQPRRGWW